MNNVAFRQMLCLRCSFRVRCRHRSTPDESLDADTVDAERVRFSMCEPPKVASRPAGGLRGAISVQARYGAAPRSKKDVSKYFHTH